jgi:hypothetical protein
MICTAAGRLQSCADAAFALDLADVKISSRHVQRIASEIGSEMANKRDEKVVQRRRRELSVRVAATPEAVAVEVDGGRLRTREVGKGPGVHEKQNKEDKVACFVTLQTQEEHQDDPQPEPPESFLEPRRVQRLVQQMQGQAGTGRRKRKSHREMRQGLGATGRGKSLAAARRRSGCGRAWRAWRAVGSSGR